MQVSGGERYAIINARWSISERLAVVKTIIMGMAMTAIAVIAAYGNTGTVTASLDGVAFSVSFANHAHETNSLWVQRVVGTTVIFR